MKPLNKLLDAMRTIVRTEMARLATRLNRATKGGVSPSAVTLIGLLAHIPIAWLIAADRLVLAGLMLIFFGLFDALDGELARLQGKASPAGMLLDASTDRMKEVILYAGVASQVIKDGRQSAIFWVVMAAGGSLLVSYVKAKGEAAVASANIGHATVNRMFQDGLMRFEVRIGVLIIGLLVDQLVIAATVVALLSWATAIQRIFLISRRLKTSV